MKPEPLPDSLPSAQPAPAKPARRSRALRLLMRLALVGYFVAGGLWLLARYVVAPELEARREQIAAAVSDALGLAVSIDQLEADWTRLHPRLRLSGVTVRDEAGRPALQLQQVQASVAWASVWQRVPIMHRLVIHGPNLQLRREADGSLYVAGLRIDPDQGGSGFSDFVLAQHEIQIHDASITWTDARRGAPPLSLTRAEFRLENRGSRHRLALAADPPPGHAARIDLRAELRGRDLSRVQDWEGEAYVDLTDTDLAVWRTWIDYPLHIERGRGSLRAWARFGPGGRTDTLTADVGLRDLLLQTARDAPMLDLTRLDGRLRLSRDGENYALAAHELALATREGLVTGPAEFALSRTAAAAGPVQWKASGRALDLAALARLTAYLPLAPTWREALTHAKPRGTVSRLALDWQGSSRADARFQVEAELAGFGIEAIDGRPGVAGLSGRVAGSERAGEFQLRLAQGGLALPEIMRTALLPIAQGELSGTWGHERAGAGETLTLKLRQLRLANDDLSVEASGAWRATPGGPGELDLQAHLPRVRAAAVARYLPWEVGEHAESWLREGLRDGAATDVRLRLRGPLAHFPFPRGEGLFRVTGQINDVLLHFAPGWPGFTDVSGKLLFEGARMRIDAQRARFGDVRLGPVRAEIPDLMAHGAEALVITGQANGPTQSFLAYLNASPLLGRIGGFSREVQAQGSGELNLKVTVPLAHSRDAKVAGEYRLQAPRLRLTPALPEMSEARAHLRFSESDFSLPEASANFLGGALRATGTTRADGALHFIASGSVPAAGLSQLAELPIWQHLGGAAAVRADITVRRNDIAVAVDSDLVGIASSLPPPLNKGAATPLPLRFEWSQEAAAELAHGRRERWLVRGDGLFSAQWVQRCTANGPCQTERAAYGVGETVALPSRGVRFGGRFDQLDLDPWRPLLAQAFRQEAGASEGAGLAGAALVAGELTFGGYRFRNVALRGTEQGRSGWSLKVDGPDLAGELTWSGAGQGRLRARLSRLALNRSTDASEPADSVAESEPGGGGESGPDSLPGIDLVAEQFRVRDKELGRLELLAANQGSEWLLQRFAVSNPHGSISGEGRWRTRIARPDTRLSFLLKSEDSGRLLERFGYPNAVRRAKTELKGDLAWMGAPTELDVASLDGQMTLKVEEGQFNKLEPGVGRLLGVLSLQSLPRRITLDFRDVFSEGFAFDAISGSMKLTRGRITTDDLEIRGPAARVSMRGAVDLRSETQDLQVAVQPTLSETVALGTALTATTGVINPVAGVVAYVAQKVLNDPVEKLFAYEYAVTGDWGDPKVSKLTTRVPAAPPKKQETQDASQPANR